jgi:hypothetical protein
MAALTIVVVVGLIVGITAYLYRDCDGDLRDDETSL